MLVESIPAKNQIIKILRKGGYPTYARLLDLFDVYLTDDPEVIAYMIPNKAKVVFNKNLDTDQISLLCRHELLHEYLDHGEREKNYNKLHGIKINEITHNLENLAADWEISNKGYTEEDKKTARRIILGDKILQGLVTELDKPGWENLTFEEMYEKLLEEHKENISDLEDLMSMLSKLNKKDLEDLEDSTEEISGAMELGDDPENSKDASSVGEEDREEDKNLDKSKNKNDVSSKAKNIKDKAEDLDKEIEDIKDKISKDNKSDSIFDSPSEQDEKKKLADRVVKIKKELKDLQVGSDMIKEVELNKQKEKAAQKAKKINTYNTSPMTRFRNNLIHFIRNQVATHRGSTWSKFNKTYARTSLLKPGISSYASGNVPSINVYWDVSRSFDDPAKTAGARAAIALLKQYEKEGKIKINVYYHATTVSNTPEGAGISNNGGELLNHIEQTKPTNVIIISDDNIDYGVGRNSVTVPGAVWILFYKSVAGKFVKHIKGKSETKIYMIDY